MYEEHFQLSERPFVLGPRVDHYFPAEAVEQARQTLARVIGRAEGPALVIGPAGCGKTMLAQVLAAQFRQDFAVVVLANGHFRTGKELLQAILFELGLPYRKLDEGEMRLALVAHVTRSERCPGGLLLLVDEAHSLSLRALEELRLVTNVIRNGEARVRLVMLGGPALEERFANPKLESFGQRLAARAYLRPWSQTETAEFVRGQLEGVGAKRERLFRPEAIDAVQRATDGIPRLVIQLCDHALALAFAGGQNTITAAGIEEAWADLQQLPAPWNETARSGAGGTEPAGGVIEFGHLDEEPATVTGEARPALRACVPDDLLADELDAELNLIETRLDDLEALDTEPVVARQPKKLERPIEPIPALHVEKFAEEEVLVDHYGALDARLARIKVRPVQADARQLADLIAQMCRPMPAVAKASAAPAPQVVVETEFYGDDIALPTYESISNSTATNDPVYPESGSITTLAAAFSRPREGQAGREARPAAPEREMPREDVDLLVIDEEPAAISPRARGHQGAWRQDYRQLFTRLRRG